MPAAESGIAGCPTVAGAHCSLDSLEIAVGLARSGSVSAVATGPVSKQQLYAIGFSHPGQTEFVAERCGVSPSNVAMMLAGPTLRTVPVTTHLPLAEVAATAVAAVDGSAPAQAVVSEQTAAQLGGATTVAMVVGTDLSRAQQELLAEALAVVDPQASVSVERGEVEGQLAGTAYGTDNTLWSTVKGLQVGRSALGSTEYFAGAIDEVRAYDGAVDPSVINQMSLLTAVPDM